MKKLILAAACVMAAATTAYADKLIVVTGVAERGIDPNMVAMNIEIWGKAATAKQAQSLAAVQYKNAKKVFDDYKIKKEDIQTEQYSLNPEYVYDNKTQQNKMVGFRVAHNVSVVLKKVEDAGAFLDALVTEKKSMDSGINVNSITWDSDKRSQTETAALTDAVKMAKAKADEIAKAAGVRITGVSKISHTPSSGGGPIPMVRAYSMKNAMAEAASTDLSGGQIKVRVDVTAEYEIN
ncbi:SIMPL domain-containing protein [Bdellovibrio sp. HCB2-146]|uniref:SIMPL domain-containing protein n=1 Tax=Bdellovibrio sp. HCB2-146 TaxID=3394362 RepID=UPI0039BC9FF4